MHMYYIQSTLQSAYKSNYTFGVWTKISEKKIILLGSQKNRNKVNGIELTCATLTLAELTVVFKA